MRISCRAASSSRVYSPRNPRSSASARSTTSRMSSSLSGCNVRSNERDSSGEMTEKNGFSVVAAISVTSRFSTAGSNASCCVLENRWTSSMNSTVCRPDIPSSRRASSRASRTSLTPALTADSSTKRRDVAWLTTCASVVFPVPGGPHKNTELPPASGFSTIRRSGVPGARSWCWPTTSSRVRGRIRTARGATARWAAAVASSNSVNASLFALLRGDGRRRAGERVAARCRLRKCDHLADRLGAGQHREHTVPPKGDTTVWRRSKRERIEQEAELRLGFVFRQADHVEYPLLHLAAVDSDRAAADLTPVHDDVVGIGERLPRHVLEGLGVLGLGRRERMMDGSPSAVAGRLEHRCVDDPQELPERLIDQPAPPADLKTRCPKQLKRRRAFT